MARVLEVPIIKPGLLALKSESPCAISSTCTVFAKSEVAGCIGAGARPEDIAAGIHMTMTAKISKPTGRVGIAPPVALTGGVALNPAFRRYLSERFGTKLWVSDMPGFTGAIGAALIALKQMHDGA